MSRFEAAVPLDRKAVVSASAPGDNRREVGPERRIGEPLKASLPSGMGEHMLVEAQLATGTDHTVELRER